MTERLRKGWVAGACVLLVLGALVWSSADVNALSTTNLRQLTRGLLWWGFRNQGTQGGVYSRTDSRSACRLSYPGMGCCMMLNMAGPDYIPYFGVKAGYSWWNQKQEAMNLSGGGSIWVLTKVGGTPGVSYSGTFNPTEDIVPLYYDIANSPEAGWGYDTKVPDHGSGAGVSMANWYPGASLQTVTADAGVPYEILNFRLDQYPDADKDDRPEDIIISRWETKDGITVTRKALAWAYQGFDDFIILECEFENTGANQLSDTYFAFTEAFVVSQGEWGNQGQPGDRGGTNPNDDYFKYTGAANYDGDASHAALKINYQYDGDSPNTILDDMGGNVDPNSREITRHPGGLKEGQLKAHQYMGMAPLAYQDAGASHVFNANDLGKFVNPPDEQPYASHWWETRDIRRAKSDCPNVSTHSEQEIYDAFTAATGDNPTGVGAYVNSQVYGPYDLAPGDKAKIVMAYACGSGASAVPREGQSKYSMDIESWAIMDIPLTDDVKRTRLAKGLDAMVDHLGAAQFAYDNLYDIPDYPPDVNFTVQSNANALNEVVWSDDVESSVNPDYGDTDIVGYRVFRSSWQEFGPWTLMGEITAGESGGAYTYSGGQYKWEDKNAIAGFRYFYNLRAVAKPRTSWTNGTATMSDLPSEVQDHLSVGLEGGYGDATQRTNLASSPYMPQTAQGDQMAKDFDVRVVPNPYSRTKAGYNYDSTLKIRFVGLPTKCTIWIYNFAGELVGQLDHDNPNSGETYWLHVERNYAVLEIATGIYFWVVESNHPDSMGKKKKGTFYVIR